MGGINIDVDPQAEFLQAVKDVAKTAAREQVAELAKGGAVQAVPHDRARRANGSAILDELRRPFAPEAVKWKIQTEWGSGAIVVAHIDARLVIERLNRVVGFNWSDTYTPLGNGFMWCALTLEGVTRYDVGKGDDAKAAVSDALKRAGVKWGIGVSIYALAAVRMERGGQPSQLRTEKKHKKGQQNKVDVCIIDTKTREWLQNAYARWLEVNVEMFGEPLSHGDQEGAMGLELETEPAEREDDDAPDVIQAEGEQADAARERARKAFDTLRERGEMLPGVFNRDLTKAGWSIEELEKFADDLEALVAREPEA